MSKSVSITALTRAGIATSLGGIALAWIACLPGIAEGAGALTVALSFFLLLLRDTTANRLLAPRRPGSLDKIGKQDAPEDAPKSASERLAELEARVRDLSAREVELRNAMKLDASSDARERRSLIFCSVTGTLVWAFGAQLVAWVLRL